MPSINGKKPTTGGGGGGGGGTVTSVGVANATLVKSGTANDPLFAVVQATVAPVAIGAQTLGSSLKSAKEDHVHAHGNQLGGALHANADGSNAGFLTSSDFTKLASVGTAAPPGTRTLTAGAGLTGGGDLSADRTFNVVANADGSLVVNADDVQVGVLATDGQHGTRGGGSIHAAVVASGANGFMLGTDKAKLDGIATSAAAVGSVTPGTVSLTAPAIGASSTAARSDHNHDLSLAIAPAWTASHTWASATVPIQASITDSSAATQLEAARFRHTSSVNGSGGIASYTGWWSTNGSGTAVETSRITSIQSVVTAGSERGVHVVSAMSSGTMTPMQWVVLGQTYTSTSFNIGALTLSSGIVTNTAIISISGTNVNYSSAAATQGGHSFTGTVNTSGARGFFVITPSSNTATTLSTAVKGFEYQTYTRQWATGAGPAEQAEYVISAPTYSAVAASTFPLASTVAISGAPIAGTNMTITQPLAFHVQAGGARFDGNIGFYGVAPAAQATGGFTCTNSVTNSGSTDGTFPDITDGTVYGNDYTNLRRTLFQHGKMIKAMWDWMRLAGPLT